MQQPQTRANVKRRRIGLHMMTAQTFQQTLRLQKSWQTLTTNFIMVMNELVLVLIKIILMD